MFSDTKQLFGPLLVLYVVQKKKAKVAWIHKILQRRKEQGTSIITPLCDLLSFEDRFYSNFEMNPYNVDAILAILKDDISK